MEKRIVGLDKARPRLGDLAADAAARRAITILTSHGHPIAAIVPAGTEPDPQWNDAVDWLLNSRHCGDPCIQAAFWGLAEGKCTRENVEEWVANGGGTE
jgi:antitoxin (DNA-binding transcriptional repressor) of toxin-antitoxin stability system